VGNLFAEVAVSQQRRCPSEANGVISDYIPCNEILMASTNTTAAPDEGEFKEERRRKTNHSSEEGIQSSMKK